MFSKIYAVYCSVIIYTIIFILNSVGKLTINTRGNLIGNSGSNLTFIHPKPWVKYQGRLGLLASICNWTRKTTMLNLKLWWSQWEALHYFGEWKIYRNKENWRSGEAFFKCHDPSEKRKKRRGKLLVLITVVYFF